MPFIMGILVMLVLKYFGGGSRDQTLTTIEQENDETKHTIS